MLWAALSYAGGIVTGFYVWRPPLWWLIAAIVFSVSADILFAVAPGPLLRLVYRLCS